jgi:hypothetical protein
MPDNINITVNETIENIVINPSISTDVIDFNITSTTENVTIDVTPNLTTVNINSISGSPVTKTSDLINDGEDGVHPFITLEDIPAVTGFVPYTGATQDVNLGEFGLQTGNIEFDLTPTNAPTGVGSMVWNDTAGTLDLKLKGGAVTLQIGQETVARVVNKTATNITLLEANYQIVRVTGAQGQRPKVDLALANNDLNSTTTLGLVTETILNNQEGFITTSGQVQQINTTGSLQGETWADGDVLYLSGTVAGQATNIKPVAPIHTVIIGFVEYAHITQGKIFVKVDNGYELEELHNVSAIAPNNNEVLTYDTPTLLWKPKTIATILGYTPFQLPALTSGSILFSNGTTIAQDNANFFWDNTNKRLNIGGIASNTARVGIKAPGALSTDIALRVRNSADTGDLMSVTGSGNTAFKTTNSNTNGTILFLNNSAATIAAATDTGSALTLLQFRSAGVHFTDLNTNGILIEESGNYGGLANSSAILQANSITKGFLPPRMTTTQKNAIATPASGLVVYDTTLGKLCVRGAAAWETITSI